MMIMNSTTIIEMRRIYKKRTIVKLSDFQEVCILPYLGSREYFTYGEPLLLPDVEGKTGKSLGLVRRGGDEGKSGTDLSWNCAEVKSSANDIIIDALRKRRHREGSCWLWWSLPCSPRPSSPAFVRHQQHQITDRHHQNSRTNTASPPFHPPSVFEATTTFT